MHRSLPPRSLIFVDVAERLVATMGPDEESADLQSRTSKQTRIRENQRRSRARRQEHLQDLEKRLSECHVTCREAELRLNAFKELQDENVRLRQLLEVLGVDENMINTFVHQDSAATPGSSNPSAMRQLKPKIALTTNLTKSGAMLKNSVTTAGHPTSLAALSPAITSTSSQPSSFFSPWSSSLDASGAAQRGTPGPSPSNFALHDPFTTQPFLPQFQDSTIYASGVYTDESFCCVVFGNKATGPLQASSENTVLCSSAKEMIDQYNINGEDLEQIKIRLAAGFAPPARPGESCRVHNHVLFEVLNDISGRLS